MIPGCLLAGTKTTDHSRIKRR